MIALIGAGRGIAQVTFASLTGLVTDPGGAVIPGATVRLTYTDTGDVREMSTGAAGRYTMSQLRPGNYELTVETAGFKRFVQSDIRLQGSQDAEINASLELGDVTETVEVTAAAIMLDSQSANQTTSLSTLEIIELPMNARNPLNQDFHFGPGTVTVYTRAAPNTTSFRAEPCTSPPAAGPKARPSAHRR